MRKNCFTNTLVDPINKIKCFLHERRQNLRQHEMVDPVVKTKPRKDNVIPTNEEPRDSIVHIP